MNKKQYLQQAYRLNELIECNKQELAELRLLSDSIPGIDYSKDKVQGSSSGSAGFTNIVEKIVELENSIRIDIEKLLSLKLEIRTVINSVKDNDEKLLLKHRYLNFLTWEGISEEMNISLRTVHRIHSNALANIKIPE